MDWARSCGRLTRFQRLRRRHDRSTAVMRRSSAGWRADRASGSFAGIEFADLSSEVVGDGLAVLIPGSLAGGMSLLEVG